MSYGVTDTGFQVKPLATIQEERQADYRATFGASIDTTPESVFGQLIDLESDREGDCWELGLALWNARTPDGAAGVSLIQLAGITGTVQDPPKRSTVLERWSGTNGTVIPAGRIISVNGTPTTRFRTIADATVGGGGYVDVPMESEEYGPYVANAGTLVNIETPVGGITSVTNTLDAEVGHGQETDASLRDRRQDELAGAGTSTEEAIRARMLRLKPVGVTGCTVFSNRTMATNGDGMPPKSVEVMVEGGDDQVVREAVWRAVPAGIEIVGSNPGTVVDSQGDSQSVPFSRPSDDLVDVEITMAVTSDYPLDGDTQVKEAIVAFADARYTVGLDVPFSSLQAPVWNIPGVYDVTQVRQRVSPAALTAANLVVASRHRARFDTSRITLIKSVVVPP